MKNTFSYFVIFLLNVTIFSNLQSSQQNSTSLQKMVVAGTAGLLAAGAITYKITTSSAQSKTTKISTEPVEAQELTTLIDQKPNTEVLTSTEPLNPFTEQTAYVEDVSKKEEIFNQFLAEASKGTPKNAELATSATPSQPAPLEAPRKQSTDCCTCFPTS